jgi:hypothetical protein
VSPRERLAAVLSPELVEAIEALVAEEVEQRLAVLDVPRRTGPAWLTLEQAGARLGCTPDAVRMRTKRGRLESRRQGRRIYVSAESVDRLR